MREIKRETRSETLPSITTLHSSQGDAASWSAMARRLLIASHAALDVALEGAEPPAAAAAARALIEARDLAVPLLCFLSPHRGPAPPILFLCV